MRERNQRDNTNEKSGTLRAALMNASPADAVAYVRKLVRAIGPGFHPDERFANYVTVKDGMPVFTADECLRLETALRRAWRILDSAGVDIYAVGLREQRRVLRRAGWK